MGHYNRSRGRSKKNSLWLAYVPVAERRAKAAKMLAAQAKKGVTLNPVVIEGLKIAKTFWGRAWCENLDTYSDYENRLPRGRTYVRSGLVFDLQITKGRVVAQVAGSFVYQIVIEVQPMPAARWKALVKACAGKIDSLIELLQGKFSEAVMQIMTEKEGACFRNPRIFL